MEIGKLAKDYAKMELEIQVNKSARGYYIGTMYNGEPISRESESYYATETSAEFALKHSTWTQRSHP